jgi:hypothetical protein
MEEQANLRVTSDQAPVVLLRDSFRTAKRIRVARVSGAAAAPAHRLVLANVRCWDAQESLFSEGLRAVVVEGETISAVSEDAAAVVGAAAARNDIVIDCGG